MFKGLFSSWVWRTVALVMSVIGLITGLTFTGALPGLGQDIGPAVAQIDASSSSAASEAGIPLAFPDLPWIHEAEGVGGSQELAVAVTETAQEAAQQQVIVQEVVAAPTPECIQQVTGAVSGLVAGVAGVATLDLAQALDAQAKTILEAAKNCATHAAAVGQAVDQANLVVQQATSVAAQVSGLVGQLAAPVQDAVQTTEPATGGVVGAVGGVVGVTLGVVQQATGLLGGVLNTALGQR